MVWTLVWAADVLRAVVAPGMYTHLCNMSITQHADAEECRAAAYPMSIASSRPTGRNWSVKNFLIVLTKSFSVEA